MSPQQHAACGPPIRIEFDGNATVYNISSTPYPALLRSNALNAV